MEYIDKQIVNNSARKNIRIIGILLTLLGFGIVVASMIISSIYNLIPCPLCVFQRIAFLTFGSLGIILLIYPPKSNIGRKIFISLVALVTAIGAGIAYWQVYLQYSPPKLSCGPELDFMVANWSITKWLPAVFSGSGDCAKIDWLFLGFSMPVWSALTFTIVFVCALVYIFRKKRI